MEFQVEDDKYQRKNDNGKLYPETTGFGQIKER